MKFLVVFALFIAAALAAPASDVTVLKNDYAHTGVGEYTFGLVKAKWNTKVVTKSDMH